MRARLAGLGDTANCPGSCSWYDWIYATDSCLQYLACADPTDPRYLCATEGAIGCAGTGIGEAVGNFASGLTSTGGGVLLLAIVAVGIMVMVKK